MNDGRDPRKALEWDAQERARREEQLGLAADGAEPRVAQYRLITRLLAEPVPESLPHDFAARVAARAEAARQIGRDDIDLWFLRILLTLLVLLGVLFVVAHAWPQLQSLITSGGNWLGQARATPAAAWFVAIALCIALSCLIDRLVRLCGWHKFYGAEPTRSP